MKISRLYRSTQLSKKLKDLEEMNTKIFKASLLCLILVIPSSLVAQDLAIKGDLIHTVSGDKIENGVILVRDGKISAIGAAANVEIPSNFQIVEGQVVTPGLVDAHSSLGLSGIYNSPADQDQLDKSNVIQPELRAIDAYNAQEPLIDWAREYGVTTINTGHGPGALSSGQTMIVKTTGKTVDDALINPNFAVLFQMGRSLNSSFKSPGTRSKGMAMLRSAFLKAQSYSKKMSEDEGGEKKLDMEALSAVLDGSMAAIISANTAVDIMAAIRLSKEFDFPLILDSAAEAYLLMDELKENNVALILHPTMKRAGGESKNISFETAAKLDEAGVPFVFQTGFEGYVPKTRVLLFEAGLAVAHGLNYDSALRKITIEPAELLGIGDRVGSLEEGKDADIVVYDGDPFEYTTHVCTVIIDGVVTDDTCK